MHPPIAEGASSAPVAALDPETLRQGLGDVVAEALAEAGRAGASAAEAAVGTGTGFSVKVRLGEVETVEHDRDRGLAVTVYMGHRKGSASTSDLSLEAVRATVRAAASIARHAAEDPCHGLADPARMATELPELDLYHPWAVRVEEAIELARACEASGRALDPRIGNSDGASVSSHTGHRVYGNSHGFLGAWSSSRHGIGCSLVARDEGGMQRGHWHTAARDAGRLEAPDAVGRRAAERAVARLGATRLATRSAPVVLAPEVAIGLIGHLVGAVRGGNLYRRASFLVGHLGRPVCAPEVHIREEPHLRGAMGSAPFDQEGVATRPRDLVRAGVLEGYVLDSYSACRLGMATTGNAGGVHNLVVTPGTEDQAALLRRMDTGLLVTDLMGMGINLVTGDYSRGATGFWVEGGDVRFPVQEVTIAGNLRDMLLGIRGVGSDVDRRGSIHTGSLLLGPLTIAGT
jgi:PmbA protein